MGSHRTSALASTFARAIFQAICSSCHAEKPASQGRCPLALQSRVSRRVYKEYIDSTRPTPLAWTPHTHAEDAQLCELDVRRCRRNALLQCAYAFPILSPLDNIRAAEVGILCDFHYVSLARRGRGATTSLKVLPYIGPMWYHRSAVEHLLHYGIATWDDVL